MVGAAVSSSRLLHLLAELVAPALREYSLWACCCLVGFFVLAVSSCVSHTVASLVLVPVAIEVGGAVGGTQFLVLSTALVCSAAMALPMTSFPNINSLLALDLQERPYLVVADFLRHGLPLSLLMVLLLDSWGFLLMSAVLSKN